MLTDIFKRKRYGRRVPAAGFALVLAAVVFSIAVFSQDASSGIVYASSRPGADVQRESGTETGSDSEAMPAALVQTDQSASVGAVTETDNGQKHVLALFSYTTSWAGEQDIYRGLINTIRSSVRLDLVFMDTKNIDKKRSEQITSEHVDLLLSREKYDAIIAVDDDALDFVLRYRDTKFSQIPVIFNNINSRERAELTAQDPLITGINENFFGKQTIEVARTLYPNAKKVIGISDHSLTGLGMSQEFNKIKDSMPDLEFETLDMMELSRSEITEIISDCSDDTILLCLNFTQDADGNIYGMEESYRFLTGITDLPLFKPDQGGVGLGILGGYGGSYEGVGERTAQIVMNVLDGADMSKMQVEEMDGFYLFDASLLDRYGVSKASLPADTRYINDEQSFLEKYALILRPAVVVIILLITIVVLLITDRRRLESLVKSQKRLSDAEIRRRKAESQSSAITQFLSSVSHDIRTPLVSIVGYTDLALNEEDNARKDEYLEKIRSSGMLLTGLVNDTLDVSRSISGKSRMNPVHTTIDKSIESVIASVSEMARKKRVRFSSKIEDGDIPVRIDQMKLQKIVLNLLTNAVKFTPPGGEVRFEIDHLKERIEGCNFKITVADTGVGISEDFQKIMYEPFVQENPDPLHMGTENGTGLGLTIVRNNVDQMGGHIELKSSPGRGTAIYAFLPIDIQDKKADNTHDSRKADYEKLRGMHVLIVEDSDMNTEVVKTMLVRKGVECVCVSDGQEAVEAFSGSEAGFFDVILMDLRMPKMNGYEACQAIRAMDRDDAAQIPIYALSADVYAEDIRRALDAGMTGHIAKPIRPETLYDALLGLNIR